jgi:predicted membrane-bound spermidine synthase
MSPESFEQSPTQSSKSRLMLTIVVFGCGFALMALEMLGARLLNPSFGSSIYVWGSVISIFLLALTVGYWVGGWLSLRKPDPHILAVVILLAGVGFALVPVFSDRVSGCIFNLELDDRWGALLGASALFLLPSLLLGIVSPFSVRLATREVAHAGASAGVLYAISTLGSFLGCIMTSFYFVLWWRVSHILWYTAAVLGVVAAVCWFIPNPRAK